MLLILRYWPVTEFPNHLLSAIGVMGSILGAGDITLNKTWSSPEGTSQIGMETDSHKESCYICKDSSVFVSVVGQRKEVVSL